MILVLLTVLVLALLAAHFLWVAESRLLFGPESFFLVLAVGTYAATAWAVGGEPHPYALFIGWGIVAFLLGTFASRLTFKFSHGRELDEFLARPWIEDLRGARMGAVLGLGALSLAVSAVYYYLLGFFVPYAALETLLTDGRQAMMGTYNELRAATSARGVYLGPGYVSQFKNCLLPLITILLYFHQRLNPRPRNRLLFAFVLVATGLALAGTGARFPLAFFGASFVALGLAPFMAPLRFSRRQIIVVMVVSMVALSGMTLMMGSRGAEKTIDVPILWAPYQVLERVFVSPSVQRLDAFDLYLADQPAQWGMGTLRELSNILPGRAEYTLSNRLHELLFGSPYGNVGLDPWGSLWYDFQWLGLIAAFGLGFALNAFYVYLLRGPKTVLRVTTLAYAGLILGLATDLQVLILRGFLSCLLFLASVRALELIAYLGQEESAARPRDLEDELSDSYSS